ncbi:phage tail tape measure protein [Chryseobacterium sp. RRHN12]|uniref:phage tail tape measure protein n=1 Tax=Chryseobacterium sp. RRHN12 TaxID=3437884 RepID=UPI003D9AF7DB
MAERIVLAQFDIDSRLLEEKIAQNQTKIDLLNGEIRDTRKAIKEYQDQAKLMAGIITEGNKAIETANEELAQGIITQQQYNYIVGLTTDVIRESEVELSRLIAVEREQQLQLVSYRTDLRNVNDENRELNTLLRSGRTEVQGNEGAYREMSQQLAAIRIEANNLGAQMRQLEREGKENTEEYRNVSQQWQEAGSRARELHDQLLELDRATGDNRRNVGNYAESIKEAFGELGAGFGQLMSGNIIGGFQAIRGSIGSVKTALAELWTAILTNPLLALAAALAAVAVGFVQGMKAVFEYNSEVAKLNKEIEGLTNLTGTVVDRLREYATAIEAVFGKEFTDGIQEMGSLMTDFGLTSKQAFDLYSKGLAKGGAMNSEFGDSIKEYGVLFAQNGYSAEEFLNLLNAGIDLDIYTDKLPDAIKEAGLSLNEQTKATRDALVNAFGQSFSDDLLKGIRNGSITIKDAVDQIATQAQKVGLNTQQIAQLNADVFKGAGEDAGGLVKIIEAVNLANNKEAMSLSQVEAATTTLTNETSNLEKAKTEAFKSDQIINFTKGFELAWTRIKTVFVQLVGGIVDAVLWFDKITGVSESVNKVMDDLANQGKAVMKAFESLGDVFKDISDALGINTDKTGSWIKSIMQAINPINLLKGVILIITSTIRTFTSVIEGSRILITTFTITAKSLIGQVIDIANDLKNLDFTAALNRLKNISISKELAEARKEAEKIIALNRSKKNDVEQVSSTTPKLKGNDKDTGASADAAAKAAAERQKILEKQQREEEAARKKAEAALEAAAKQDLANAKERANIAIQATQAELAEYIAMNAEKLKSDKRLTQEKVNEMQRYLESVREKSQIANELEKQQKIQSLNDQIEAIKGFSQQEIAQKENLEAQKVIITKEYATKELILNNEANDKRKELDKKFLEEKTQASNLARALEFQKQLADLETNGATEFELQKAQLNQQTEQRLTSFLEENELKRQLDQENYDINAEIEAQRREVENQLALEQDEIKKTNLENLLSNLNIIQQDYANKDVKISQDKELSKWGLASSVALGMAKVAGEQTEAGKTLAVAAATIDTIAGSVRALKDYPAPYSYILMGTTIAAGLAQVAKIQGVDTGGAAAGIAGISSAVTSFAPKKTAKAANGMLIGPSHANGGIQIKTPDGMIEAEGGEVIINKRSSAMYRGLLSQINQIGGGVKFASGGILGNLSSLSTVQNNFKSVIDMDAMRQIVGEAVLEGSMQGTLAGSQMGIVELSNNREIQNGANF